ncbi:unnamed protein product [Rotaria sp. Silwood2]|nr:unnamed protein product [Rotaria sp. Silwood2]
MLLSSQDMAQTLESEIPYKDMRNDGNTLALRSTVTFSEDDLNEQAKKQFKFHDEILCTFQLYANHVLANDRLSPMGRHLVCTILERNYKNSKLVLNYMASHPEVKMANNPLPHPLVVCGMPRTGSTLLYNLLACDPACPALLYAEMAQPVPPLARSDTTGQMQRNNSLQGFREMFITLGLNGHLRNMRASHPQLPYEEDLYFLYHTGYNWLHTMLASHDDNELLMWLENDINKKFIYEYHKIFIQMLNSIDAPSSHWLFKTPYHTLYLDEFMHHYPSAMLIMTHRRLDDALASMSRSASVYAAPYFDNNKADTAIDIQTVVKRILHLLDTLIHRLVKFRRNHPYIPCFDVQYDDLLAHPINTVRRIYNHFNLSWSEEFETTMSAWLRDNPQGKQGRNSYTLDNCEMTLDDIELRYNEYISMFLGSQHSLNIGCSMTKSADSMIHSLESPSEK